MSYNNDRGITPGIIRVFTFCPYYVRAGSHKFTKEGCRNLQLADCIVRTIQVCLGSPFIVAKNREKGAKKHGTGLQDWH